MSKQICVKLGLMIFSKNKLYSKESSDRFYFLSILSTQKWKQKWVLDMLSHLKMQKEEMKWMQKAWPSNSCELTRESEQEPCFLFFIFLSSLNTEQNGIPIWKGCRLWLFPARRSFVFDLHRVYAAAAPQPWITFAGIQFNSVKETPHRPMPKCCKFQNPLKLFLSLDCYKILCHPESCLPIL